MRSSKSDPATLSSPPSLVTQLANEMRRAVLHQPERKHGDCTSAALQHDGSRVLMGFRGAIELWDFKGETEQRLLGWIPIASEAGVSLCEFIGNMPTTTLGAFVDATELNVVRFIGQGGSLWDKLTEFTDPLRFEQPIASLRSNVRFVVIGMRDVLSLWMISPTQDGGAMLKPHSNVRNTMCLNDVVALGPSRWLAFVATQQPLSLRYFNATSNTTNTTPSDGSTTLSSWPVILDEAIRSVTRGGVQTTNLLRKESPFAIVIRDVVRSKDVVRISARDQVQYLAFDRSGGLVLYSQLHGRVLFVNSLPDGKTLYKLDRGLIPTSISSSSFSWDGKFVALTSFHGTTHVFALNPGFMGGSPSVFTHPCSETRGSRNNTLLVDAVSFLTASLGTSASKMFNTPPPPPPVKSPSSSGGMMFDDPLAASSNDVPQPVITTTTITQNDEFVEIDPPLATVTTPGVLASHDTTLGGGGGTDEDVKDRPDAFQDSVVVLNPVSRVRVASSLYGLIPISRFTSNGKLVLISGDATIVAYRFVVFANADSGIGLEPTMVSRFPSISRESPRMPIVELAAFNRSFHFDGDSPAVTDTPTVSTPMMGGISHPDRFHRVTHQSPILPIWQQNFTLVPLADDPPELLEQHDDYVQNPAHDVLLVKHPAPTVLVPPVIVTSASSLTGLHKKIL